MERMKVGILVFPDVEVLDFAGPFEVFSATRLNESSRYSESSPFEVFLIAESEDPITTAGGLRVLPDGEDDPGLDMRTHALRGHFQVVFARRQISKDVAAFGICRSGVSKAFLCVNQDNFGARNDSA